MWLSCCLRANARLRDASRRRGRASSNSPVHSQVRSLAAIAHQCGMGSGWVLCGSHSGNPSLQSNHTAHATPLLAEGLGPKPGLPVLAACPEQQKKQSQAMLLSHWVFKEPQGHTEMETKGEENIFTDSRRCAACLHSSQSARSSSQPQ